MAARPSAVDLVESTRFAIEAILVAAFDGPGRARPLDDEAGAPSGAGDTDVMAAGCGDAGMCQRRRSIGATSLTTAASTR